jgi:hypothetical protein
MEETERPIPVADRSIPSVAKPVPLYTWWTENTIDDEMLWKQAASNQMHFVDDLNGLMQNRLKKDERKQVQVISEHMSKSILLPVYLLERGDLQIILRYNFYNWKISVVCNRKVDANFDGLFHTTPPIEPDYTGNELADVYFEGFPKDLVFDYFEESDKKVWSAQIHDDKILWTTIYLILKAVGYVVPTEWRTKASHQKELDERAAEREKKDE